MVNTLLEFLARCGVLDCHEQVLVAADPLTARVTTVFPNCSFKGEIKTDGDVVVFGQYSGCIDAGSGSVYLQPGSSVTDVDIQCRYLEVKGTAQGITAIAKKFVFDGELGKLGPMEGKPSRIHYEQMSLRNAEHFDAELKRIIFDAG